jgi:hypothetical protein
MDCGETSLDPPSARFTAICFGTRDAPAGRAFEAAHAHFETPLNLALSPG